MEAFGFFRVKRKREAFSATRSVSPVSRSLTLACNPHRFRYKPKKKSKTKLIIGFSADKSKTDSYGTPWERSGLYQGDIATSPADLRNTLYAPERKWDMPIPVFINGSDFGKIILLSN